MSRIVIKSSENSFPDIVLAAEEVPDPSYQDPLDQALCESLPELGEYIFERQNRFKTRDGYMLREIKRSLLKKEIAPPTCKILATRMRRFAIAYGENASDSILEQFLILMWIADLYSGSPDIFKCGIVPRVIYQSKAIDGKRNDADRRTIQRKRESRLVTKPERAMRNIASQLAGIGISQEEGEAILQRVAQAKEKENPIRTSSPPEFGLITIEEPWLRNPLKTFVCRTLAVTKMPKERRAIRPVPRQIAEILNFAGLFHPTTKQPFCENQIRSLSRSCTKYLG